MGAQVGQPVGERERRVRQRLRPLCGEGRLEGLGVVAPAARVTHHHLEQRGPLWSGDDGAECGAEWQLDVGPGRTATVAEADFALDYEDHVGGEVTMAAHHHPRVIAGVDRQVLGVGENASHFSQTWATEPSALRWALIACQGTSGSSRCRKVGSRPSRLGDDGML